MSCMSRAGWSCGMLSASKLCRSSSTHGPSSRSKPIARQTSSSSRQHLRARGGSCRPRAARPGSVASTHSESAERGLAARPRGSRAARRRAASMRLLRLVGVAADRPALLAAAACRSHAGRLLPCGPSVLGLERAQLRAASRAGLDARLGAEGAHRRPTRVVGIRSMSCTLSPGHAIPQHAGGERRDPARPREARVRSGRHRRRARAFRRLRDLTTRRSAFGSWIASSDSDLRLSSMPAFLRPATKRLYISPRARAAALRRTIQRLRKSRFLSRRPL